MYSGRLQPGEKLRNIPTYYSLVSVAQLVEHRSVANPIFR
jgi:hypothetical protein